MKEYRNRRKYYLVYGSGDRKKKEIVFACVIVQRELGRAHAVIIIRTTRIIAFQLFGCYLEF